MFLIELRLFGNVREFLEKVNVNLFRNNIFVILWLGEKIEDDDCDFINFYR